MPVGRSSRNDELQLVKEEPARFLEEANAYKTEKENHEKTLLEKRVEMKAIVSYVVNMERT